MRGLLTLLSLLAFASTSVFASPVDQCLDEYCGGKGFSNGSPGLTDPATSIAKIETPTRSIPERSLEEMTIAEHFSRGLLPKKPEQFRGSREGQTEVSAVPRTIYRGFIQVSRLDDGEILGYIAARPFSNTVYLHKPDFTHALVVSLMAEDSQAFGPVSDLITGNPDTTRFPFLGLLQGRDNTDSNLSVGSFHYLYITDTNQTPPGSTPSNVGNSYSDFTGLSRTSQSAVWQYNSETREITAQWVNTDGKKPAITLFSQNTVLYAGGDVDAFSAEYPSPVIRLKYTFIHT